MALTPKQEAFCQAITTGINSSDAYRKTYPTDKMNAAGVNRRAKELMDNGKISARIAELRKPVIEELQLTLKQHLDDLKDLRDRAATKGQFAAAITAEIARGRASGFYEPKQTDDGKEDLASALQRLADKLPGA